MSQFQGGAGYQGSDFTVVPSGGGAFKPWFEGSPVPGVYSGSCPGDPGCPGREVERSGTSGWADVGKALVLKGTGALIEKYLSRSGTPAQRTAPSSSKGEGGSWTETAPGAPGMVEYPWTDKATDPSAPVGNGPTVNPAYLVLGLALVAGAALFMKGRR